MGIFNRRVEKVIYDHERKWQSELIWRVLSEIFAWNWAYSDRDPECNDENTSLVMNSFVCCSKCSVNAITCTWNGTETNKCTMSLSICSKAPFTRVRTNFCTDEFCTWTTCLHGTMQILLQIAVVFTWVRANFETSRVSAMIGWSFCSQPITLLLKACGKSKMAT